jgi:hypothetical protein
MFLLGAFAVIAVCAASIGFTSSDDSLFGTTPRTNETQQVQPQTAEEPITNISIGEASSNSEAASP